MIITESINPGPKTAPKIALFLTRDEALQIVLALDQLGKAHPRSKRVQKLVKEAQEIPAF